MRANRLPVAFAMLVLIACGGKGKGPLISKDADGATPTGDVADVGHEVCTPSCAERQCGPDGCGGTCGTCGMQADQCSDEGQCVPYPCSSSKDCPGDLICATDDGECVVCVGNEDCPETEVCGLDHVCHVQIPCVSDKDCKEFGLLCDKTAGKCVQCMFSSACPASQYCLAGYCLDDNCTAGESHCDGPDVLTCQEDGGGEILVETCKGLDYCEDGACHEPVCPPAEVWCEGNVLKVCADDGKVIESETDCAMSDQLCVVDECAACSCVPGAKACLDDSTAGECAEDCLGMVEVLCGAEQSCLGGECVAWLCGPDSIFCVGEVRKVCAHDGLSIQSQEDCSTKQQLCVDGKCEDFVCVPSSTTCLDPATLKHCSEDGLAFEPEPCLESFCQDGKCLPWKCQPGVALCDGEVATQCDPFGSGPASGGTDCVKAGGCCADGVCLKAGPEVCDGKDNDCDGEVDEDVLSPCGDCNPACQLESCGPGGDEPFEPGGENGYGVALNEKGFLVTDFGKVVPPNLWVANSGEGTISKIHTGEVKEKGRYKVCSDPSRTAVDLHGNVYAGCRADGGVAKIVGDPAKCKDKNGNGLIETSSDKNVLPAGQDECVAYITYPGGTCARALGVDRDNNVWVGDWNGQTLKRLKSEDGTVLQSISLGCNPYGLVIDAAGIIWISGRGCDKLIRVDPSTSGVQKLSPPTGNLYGITVDAKGRIWMGHYSSGGISRYDPATGQFVWTTTNLGGKCPRGMAGSVDGWMFSGLGCGNEHHIVKIPIDDANNVKIVDIGGTNKTTVGVALDSQGFLWAVNYSASSATRIDYKAETAVGEIVVGANPYTYSDMTGYVLHNFTAPDLNPFFIHKFATQDGGVATWLSLQLEASSNGGCETMSVLARPAPSGGPAVPWTLMAEGVPLQSAEFPLAGLPAGLAAIEVKLVLPYQSGGCEFAVESLSATWLVQ